MKKIFNFLLVFTLLCAIITLSSCDKPDDEPQGTPKEVVETHSISKALKNSLLEYFRVYASNLSFEYKNLEAKLDLLKTGEKNAYSVVFEPDDCYFVGVYYNQEHEYEEKDTFCCVKEYKWIGFNNSSEIKEYSENMKIVCAFQINTPSFCENIITPDNRLIGCYRIFETEFVNGVNTALPIKPEESLVCFSDSEREEDYFFYDNQVLLNETLKKVTLDGEDYIAVPHYKILSNSGGRIDANINYEFGKYYDSLTEIAEIDTYNESISKGGDTQFYILFEVESLKNLVLN